ncbi:MAG TPA: PAS domain-containing sensor histidine kinase [Desulfobacteraceae bacterium]|nr:PAS domain-containing sensor histidine kinase [Desulfobacteraceae bacterium]
MKNKVHISPWMTIGSSLVLMAIVGFLGVVNYSRDKEQMSKLLEEKGAALIRAFEAGTRTGMMGMMTRMGAAANERHLQILLEETADQPDISYISIVNHNGVILAHNEKDLIGGQFVPPPVLESISPSDDPNWRIVGPQGQHRYFEVFKTFMPGVNHQRHFHQHLKQHGSDETIMDPSSPPYIFIGMNIAPFELAMREDLKHNLVMAAIIFSLGIAGVISLFWAQSYTRSRKLLQDTQKIAAEVVANLPEGILVMDTRYHVVYSNSLVWHLLGISEKSADTTDARTFLPENLWDLYTAIKSGKTKAEKEICLLPETGKPVPVVVGATDIHGPTGEYIGFMFVFRDLSEIRALELKNQRVEKLATVGNLAAGIAHEVRNPLSSIKGYVTYFGSLFEPGSDNRKAADLMTEEVDRVNRVITELLEFARPTDLKPKNIRVTDLVDHSLRVIAHEAEAAGVKIKKILPRDLPEIHADLDRLTQVFLNLYINALQSMASGGELTVEACHDDEQVVIRITDTGCGIPEAVVSQIFDPYFTTKNKGTGLGLAIAQKIVEHHNGTIMIRSTENSGTRVSVKLPLGTNEE